MGEKIIARNVPKIIAALRTAGAGMKKLTVAPAASLFLENALNWLRVGANGLLHHHPN